MSKKQNQPDTNKDRGLQPPRNPPRMPAVKPPKTNSETLGS